MMNPEGYRVRHEVCPNCGKDEFMEWTIGWIGGRGRNPNQRTCLRCQCKWWAPEIVKPGTEAEKL